MASWSSQRRCHHFSLAEIEKATDSFNRANFLGKGGEGEVFKGVLVLDLDGGLKSNVAVKRLERLNSGEYEKEIKMLSELYHANLVSLVGYCQQSEENILVYEFMPNGSLHDNLYRTPRSLSWEQRLNICIGAACGLEYLHTHNKIIHRDVKPRNILLDENFAAKISDFGLSKRVPPNQTDSLVITAHARGTPGYCAPELRWYGKITRRVDVFAFGVVLFEVLCKKKPWEQDDSNVDVEYGSYGKWAQQNVDPDLKGEISQSCLEAFIDIAEKCLNKDHPDQRPSMDEVVSKLIHASKLQKSTDFGGSSRIVTNGEKRLVDSGSSSKSPDSVKTLAQGDFRRRKSAKLEEKTSPDGDDSSAKLEKTRQEGGSKSDSTKASQEIKPRQETRAYESSGVKDELGSQDGKYSYPVREDGKIQKDFNSGGESTKKEDTTRDISNACESSRTLSDIPSTEDKVVLYYCTSTNEAVTDYLKTRLYLNTYGVDIDERDPTINEKYQVELSRFFTQKQKKFSLPQLFIGGKHIGGANEVVRLHDSGELSVYL